VSGTISPAEAARAVLDATAEGRPVAVVVAVDPAGEVSRLLYYDDETRGTLDGAVLQDSAIRRARELLEGEEAGPVVETVQLGDSAWLLYIEVHRPPEHLVIVGAGHIAVPLAHLGRLLSFRVTVLDDRDEFATTERFDEGVDVVRADFERDPFAGVRLDRRTYVALVTRGHRWDFDCLRRLLELDRPPHYIGMIGSRRRVRAAFSALLAAGTPRSALATIHAPIGIEVKAETPAEIAVSIAAELIAVRRGADAVTMSHRERVLDRLLRDDPKEEPSDA
jgi:xanthine dehydrogenase accessory factor